MNKIEWSDEKKQVVCEAGAITDVVKDFADSHGRLLPISLGRDSRPHFPCIPETGEQGSLQFHVEKFDDLSAKVS